jgi:hypothetical protein
MDLADVSTQLVCWSKDQDVPDFCFPSMPFILSAVNELPYIASHLKNSTKISMLQIK